MRMLTASLTIFLAAIVFNVEVASACPAGTSFAAYRGQAGCWKNMGYTGVGANWQVVRCKKVATNAVCRFQDKHTDRRDPGRYYCCARVTQKFIRQSLARGLRPTTVTN